MTPLLITPRLRLRAPGLGDATRLTQFLSNSAVSGNLAHVPHPYTIAHAHEWLGNWRADSAPGLTHFVIELMGEGAIGSIGFRNAKGRTHIGYWLGEPFWGQGLMTEAITEVLRWYFAEAKADDVASGVFHFNMASLAIQQKLGFVETGRSMVHSLARDQDVEHIDTELTRDVFEVYLERIGGNRKLAQ